MDEDKELKELFDDPLFRNVKAGDEEKKLFDLQEPLRKAAEEKSKPDYVAKHKICEDFDNYALLFKKVHKELHEGKRSIGKMTTSLSMESGNFFIVSGVMVYLEKIINPYKNEQHKIDGRTRCIYENGTESDLMLQSLRKAITEDGYVVTENQDNLFKGTVNGIEEADVADGWIYVLSSLSDDPQIKNQRNLYKIGFTTVPVEQRIANAEHDPTYLMAGVKIVATFRTYNLNTHKLETLIHNFFNTVQFKIEIKDADGNKVKATEWYIVPYKIIEKVIEKINDRTIVDYVYNPELQALELSKGQNMKCSPKIDTTGWAVLSLIIKKIFFDEILEGEKTTEYRELKQTTMSKFTWLDKETGNRYLKKYDAIRFYVGYNREREMALVEVKDTQYDKNTGIISYQLGKILETQTSNKEEVE